MGRKESGAKVASQFGAVAMPPKPRLLLHRCSPVVAQAPRTV